MGRLASDAHGAFTLKARKSGSGRFLIGAKSASSQPFAVVSYRIRPADSLLRANHLSIVAIAAGALLIAASIWRRSRKKPR